MKIDRLLSIIVYLLNRDLVSARTLDEKHKKLFVDFSMLKGTQDHSDVFRTVERALDENRLLKRPRRAVYSHSAKAGSSVGSTAPDARPVEPESISGRETAMPGSILRALPIASSAFG